MFHVLIFLLERHESNSPDSKKIQLGAIMIVVLLACRQLIDCSCYDYPRIIGSQTIEPYLNLTISVCHNRGHIAQYYYNVN